MEWSNESCLNVIQHYQVHSVLWNPKHNYYFSKTIKSKAWEIIAKNLNRDVEDVKKKAKVCWVLMGVKKPKVKEQWELVQVYIIYTYYKWILFSIKYSAGFFIN